MMGHEFKTAPASSIHHSPIIPHREHGEDLMDTVKRLGVQQPLIVRSITGKPDEFEMIDGQGRLDALNEDEQVVIDVRHDLKDSEAFGVADATFHRKERTAFETSVFLSAWLRALEKEEGTVDGIQQQLATEANLSESSLSQYLSIANMFEKLRTITPKEQFSQLKTWSINKLYKLAELTEDDRLLNLVNYFEMKADVSVEEVQDSVNALVHAEEMPQSLSEESNPTSQNGVSGMYPQSPSTILHGESKKLFLKNARKVGLLAEETNTSLNGLVQELVQNVDSFSSGELLQILTHILRTLKKLKKDSTNLKTKMIPYKPPEAPQ
jgi:hypothetical protein